jgi:hypothetical protein
MSDDANPLLSLIGILLFEYVMALILGYGRVKRIHYPFTKRQSQMWRYCGVGLPLPRSGCDKSAY